MAMERGNGTLSLQRWAPETMVCTAPLAFKVEVTRVGGGRGKWPTGLASQRGHGGLARYRDKRGQGPGRGSGPNLTLRGRDGSLVGTTRRGARSEWQRPRSGCDARSRTRMQACWRWRQALWHVRGEFGWVG
jgi:hypothetical protein